MREVTTNIKPLEIMQRAHMAGNDEAVEQYQWALCAWGYYVYKDIWEAVTGETLVWMTEPGNSNDRNVVAVEKDGRVIGHFPRSVAIVRFLREEDTRSLHCNSYSAVQFFVGLIVRSP